MLPNPDAVPENFTILSSICSAANVEGTRQGRAILGTLLLESVSGTPAPMWIR